MTAYVTIPRAVVDRALGKARSEYTRLTDDAEPGECWAEFEALADAIADHHPRRHVTLHDKRYVYVCWACDDLADSGRPDAVTCSPACRVWLHRHPDHREPLEMATAHANALGADDCVIPPAMILQHKAIVRLRPDLADEIKAGKRSVDDCRADVYQAYLEIIVRAATEDTEAT